MNDKRTFLERLLGKKEKTVIEKDKNGITGKTEYRYDKNGGVIGMTTSTYDSATKTYKKTKEKTYVRRSDGEYDPKETLYYNSDGRVIKQKAYRRDEAGDYFKGMLICDYTKISYTPDGHRSGMLSQTSTYDAGNWTPRHQEESQFDQFGALIEQKISVHSPKTYGLVCIKDKTYTRCPDGTYDPKETIYRDTEGRLTKTKTYQREQTRLEEKPLLSGTETTFEYDEAGKSTQKTRKLYRIQHGALNFWGSENDLEFLINSRIKDLEGELAGLKGEKKEVSPSPIQLAALKQQDGR